MDFKVIILLIVVLLACNLKHEQREVNDKDSKYYGFLEKDETRYLVESAIHFSLKNFQTTDFSIYPVFNRNLTDDMIRESLMNYVNADDLNEMIKVYHQNHGDSICGLLTEQFCNKIGSELKSVLVAVSYPLIDVSNERVYFYSEVYYPYNEGVVVDKIFYGFKNKDHEWGLFKTIEVVNK